MPQTGKVHDGASRGGPSGVPLSIAAWCSDGINESYGVLAGSHQHPVIAGHRACAHAVLGSSVVGSSSLAFLGRDTLRLPRGLVAWDLAWRSSPSCF